MEGDVPRFRHRREMNELFRGRLNILHREILARNRNGEDLPCSSQIMEEASWLVNYTDRADAAEERIVALAASLHDDGARQLWAREQDPEDGSFGGCFREWFLRLHASVDPLKQLLRSGQRPRYPMRLLDRVATPERMLAYMSSLMVSEPLVDGLDKRKELNFAVTALGQLLLVPEMAPALPEGWPRKELAAALIGFMDGQWQDPDSGYWGAWYRIGDRLVKTDDLSITFHIASYRDGKINHLRKLVHTTYLNRTKPYPYGWLDRGLQNNHHAYNVVRLLRLGWPHLSAAERSNAQGEIDIILSRALRFSVSPQGEFDANPYNRVAEAYYFGVSLLDEIGYFRASRNFWSTMSFLPDSDALRLRILSQLDGAIRDDPMIQAARDKLMARD